MPQLPIAVQLSGLRLPFKESLIAASRIGARGVEIDARGPLRPGDLSGVALRDVRRLLDDLNLRVVSVGFRTRRGYDAADQLDRRVEATKAAMRFAADLRAPVVINELGRVPAESEGTIWNQLVEVLSDLAIYGQKHGSLLAAQTGGESGADLARLLDALPEHGVLVDFDPGRLVMGGFSTLESLAALGGRVAHVHARDAARDFARGRGVETPLGRGAVDFAELLGALEEQGYRGPLTIAREESNDPLTDFELAVKYLKSL